MYYILLDVVSCPDPTLRAGSGHKTMLDMQGQVYRTNSEYHMTVIKCIPEPIKHLSSSMLISLVALCVRDQSGFNFYLS